MATTGDPAARLPASFIVARNSDPGVAETVPIEVGGTARNGVDFGTVGDAITFAPEDQTVTLPIRTAPGPFVGARTVDLSLPTVTTPADPSIPTGVALPIGASLNLSGATGTAEPIAFNRTSVNDVPRLGRSPGAITQGPRTPAALVPVDASVLVDQTPTTVPTTVLPGTPVVGTPIDPVIQRLTTPLVNVDSLNFPVPASRIFTGVGTPTFSGRVDTSAVFSDDVISPAFDAGMAAARVTSRAAVPFAG